MKKPNVLYRFYDSADTLLYIGITNSPLARMSRHSRDKAWFRTAARTTYEHFTSRAELEAAEIAAIRAEKPKYNIAYSVAPTPQTMGAVKPRARYVSSRSDANHFQRPDAIACDDEPTDDERIATQLELERKSRQWLRERRCPSCERPNLYREYDGLIRCDSCLNMWTPEEFPSMLEVLKRQLAEESQ